MRFVSRSVVTGFVNALAILIFMAQLPELIGASWMVYAMVAAGLGIIYLFPLLTKAVPSPLVCIVVLTGVAMALGLNIRTVGDMGQLPDSLPIFLLPDLPLNLQTLTIIFPYALTLAVVGLLESMMTASIVDDLTDTTSNQNRECMGQGVANIASGFLGGMAGCAMIGQSVINIKSGGRGRLSTLAAGVFLLVMVVFLGKWVSQIPMAALVAVMVMVSIGTFSWESLKNIRKHPPSSTIVMVATVVVVVATHDLAKGVFVGVLLSGLFFAHKVGRFLQVTSESSAGSAGSTGSDRNEGGGVRDYKVVGQVFFASSTTFINSFDFKEVLQRVVIDVSRAHFWDITAINALDKVVLKFRREGTVVDVVGLNEASTTLVDQFAIHDKSESAVQVIGH